MTNAPLIDSGYLAAVQPARAQVAARIARLAEYSSSPEATLEFLLCFLGLRMGPLRAIPTWLELSAAACEGRYPGVADDLREAAALERSHQALLERDVEDLLAHAGRERVSLPDDPRIDRHTRVRGLVPARDEPLVVVAIDLELALLGQLLGPMLVVTCRQHLPLVDGGRFIRVRTDNAITRAAARSKRLRSALQRHPERGREWAGVASEVILSYLSAVEACARVPVQQAA